MGANVLRQELLNDPLNIGYASMSAEEVANSLNAKTRIRKKLVPRGILRQIFDNFVNVNFVLVWELIERYKNDDSSLGMACRAAIRLRDAPGDYPDINVENPIFQTQLNLLKSAGILTDAQIAEINALGVEYISRAEELQLGNRVKVGWVIDARKEN